ncbi:unnamed protein product [Cladocopium goreaui]|uniref:Uncharacterized protein n=1 Tax=Cladocopium goreaui TaxID=2562237 RepID=A0A9P1FJT8_9DINO|nr:unnamed protein product [Cladocopium goreaui]
MASCGSEARRGCEDPPEPPAVPRLPRPQSAHRQARKQEQQALHQPALPQQVHPRLGRLRRGAVAARPALKPRGVTEPGPLGPELLDPAVVAASRLMQEAYTSGTELGETSEDDDEIQRWSPPSSESSNSESFLGSAWRAASSFMTWITPAAMDRFWGKVHCEEMLPGVCCSPPLLAPEEAKVSITAGLGKKPASSATRPAKLRKRFGASAVLRG